MAEGHSKRNQETDTNNEFKILLILEISRPAQAPAKAVILAQVMDLGVVVALPELEAVQKKQKQLKKRTF